MDLINTSFLHNKEVVMVIRLVVAAILGGIVGIERGSGDRPAGFRTHILVCVGSALFMLVSLYGFDFFASLSLSGSRTAAQVPHDFGGERSYVEALLAQDPRFRLIAAA